MKKIWLGVGSMLIPLALCASGCSQSQLDRAKENISEITYNYFYGKCDDFEISISSGEREEPYVYDGKSAGKCDFALVVARINGKNEKEPITFSINGDASSQMLEYNLMTGTYMLDLEKELMAEDVISVKYGNSQITLDNLAKDFAVDYNKAIEIGVNEFSEEINGMIEKEEFKAECYLKILDNLSNGYDTRFWCFSIVNEQGEHLNCVIDIMSGEIVART